MDRSVVLGWRDWACGFRGSVLFTSDLAVQGLACTSSWPGRCSSWRSPKVWSSHFHSVYFSWLFWFLWNFKNPEIFKREWRPFTCAALGPSWWERGKVRPGTSCRGSWSRWWWPGCGCSKGSSCLVSEPRCVNKCIAMFASNKKITYAKLGKNSLSIYSSRSNSRGKVEGPWKVY